MTDLFTLADAWNELVHKDDRTSPEDYPDMCLISFDELKDFMERHLPGVPQEASDTPGAAVLKHADELHELGFNDGWNGAVDECAKFVEQRQENIKETSNGSERYLAPRKVGNQMGLAYVNGLRSLTVLRKGD